MVYGLSYGMGKRNLGRFGKEFDPDAESHRRVIEEVFGMKPKEAGRLLLQHPLIAALLGSSGGGVRARACGRRAHGLLRSLDQGGGPYDRSA